MTRKTSPQRRAAFLAALRATGNQTLAAERARVSRSWVQLHRSSDAAFDGAVREAMAEAKEKLQVTEPTDRAPSGEGDRASRLPTGPISMGRSWSFGGAAGPGGGAGADCAGAVAAVDAADGGALSRHARGDLQRQGGLRRGGAFRAFRLQASRALAGVRAGLGRGGRGGLRRARGGAAGGGGEPLLRRPRRSRPTAPSRRRRSRRWTRIRRCTCSICTNIISRARAGCRGVRQAGRRRRSSMRRSSGRWRGWSGGRRGWRRAALSGLSRPARRCR